MSKYGNVLFFLCFFIYNTLASAAVITATSCSQDDVVIAIDSAAAEDTVQVPAGNCTWNGLIIDKAIYLKGAGVGLTNIDITDNTLIKQAVGIIRVSDFSFTKSGGGPESKGFIVDGLWQGADPIIFQNNDFTISDSGLFVLHVAGGVIIANNSFTGDWDDSFIQPKDDQDAQNSWGVSDTMGIKDTTGKLNIYVENNYFYGGTNQGIDCDDSTRCVYRYNTLTYSSFNTHGLASSPVGVRHFEVYNNTFIHFNETVQIADQNWSIWIRGGTGVIFYNEIADISGDEWGDKKEVRLTVRGAEDVRPQGSCENVSYPVPRQLGQNHDGTGYFTDPIYIWGNTGTVVLDPGWNWDNPCGLTFTDFFQWGRDGISDGTSKPGYTPYVYPHPLLISGLTSPMPKCSDGLDNDSDGLIDLADPGCLGDTDGDEFNGKTKGKGGNGGGGNGGGGNGGGGNGKGKNK